MLRAKIQLTDRLLNYIKNTRKEKGISASELSIAIGRTSGYISTMENKRISNILSKDLIKMFEVFYYIPKEEAITQIEELLYGTSKQKYIKPSTPIIDENSPNWGNFTDIIKYDLPFNFHYADLFNIELRKVVAYFKFYFKKNNEDAFSCIQSFVFSLKFDLGFMMALFKLPYYGLENLNTEERQNVLDDINNVVKKYRTISDSREKEIDKCDIKY